MIAAGQSLYEEKIFDELKKNPDIIVLSTDNTLKYVLEQNIIPEYTCMQENLIRPKDQYDFFPDFFYHGIIKSHADKITLYYSQLVSPERLKIFNEMGFKIVPFVRLGKGTGKGETIDTAGNCGMALVQIARHILKIDKIAILGIDLDYTTSWKAFTDKPHILDPMLNNTKHKLTCDYFESGTPIFNLTRLGNLHGKGIKESNIIDFIENE